MHVLEERREGDRKERRKKEGRKEQTANVVVWMATDGYGYHTLLQRKDGQSEVQVLGVDLIIEGNLRCRDLANSFVKT